MEGGAEMKKPLICDQCPATFSTQFSLRKHKEKHGRPVPMVKPKPGHVYCKHCKIAFQSVDSLSAHMEIEHDERIKVKPITVVAASSVDGNGM